MTGKWRIALIATAVAVVVAGGVIGLRYALGPPGGLDGFGDGEKARIQQVLKEHDAELRDLPGLTSLGIHMYQGAPPRIVLRFREVTPLAAGAVRRGSATVRAEVGDDALAFASFDVRRCRARWPPRSPLRQAVPGSVTTTVAAASGGAGLGGHHGRRCVRPCRAR